MIVKTKMLVIEYNEETESRTERWDLFGFDLSKYAAHAMEGDHSELFLVGLPHSIIIQLSFEELTSELEIFNTFETVSLN